ncbi:MAG TPA: O-methyltransferase [Puia sp.]|nr:O-methyltransferase [Puia sp.]
MTKTIFEEVDDYTGKLFGDQDRDLEATERAIEAAHIPQISVSPNQGKFLHVLARACQAKSILEIGTLGGYSTIWMARALPANGRLITLEVDPKHAAVAQDNFTRAGLDGLIEIRIGKALDLMPPMVDEGIGPFDMIFIDADKSPYAEYFQWALKLSRPGTLIIADNVIREGKVLDANSQDEMVKGVQRFNAALAASTAVTATIIQTVGAKEHDGMALAVVR